MLCPPATPDRADALADREVARCSSAGRTAIPKPSGAHTGDISAEMLKDAGATAVIVGHSERRTDHGETDALVRAKAEAARRAGLTAIICIGETEAERDAGKTLDVVVAAARRLRSRRRAGRYRHRLRAGLGDRHRPDAERG